MVLVLGRELLILRSSSTSPRGPLGVALIGLVALAACARDRGGELPAPVDSAPRVAASVPGAGGPPLPQTVPNGQPMPAAAEAGGIPPYPGATVYVRKPRQSPVIHSLQAFTTDPWDDVVAFYKESLPGWKVTEAHDMTIFEMGDDESVTVSPWDAEHVPASEPDALKRARTAIGMAWRAERR